MSILEDIKQDLTSTNFTATFNAIREDVVKELTALAEVADKAHKDYENSTPISNYNYTDDYRQKLDVLWDVRDAIKAEIEELNSFDEIEYLKELLVDEENSVSNIFTKKENGYPY